MKNPWENPWTLEHPWKSCYFHHLYLNKEMRWSLLTVSPWFEMGGSTTNQIRVIVSNRSHNCTYHRCFCQPIIHTLIFVYMYMLILYIHIMYVWLYVHMHYVYIYIHIHFQMAFPWFFPSTKSAFFPPRNYINKGTSCDSSTFDCPKNRAPGTVVLGRLQKFWRLWE